MKFLCFLLWILLLVGCASDKPTGKTEAEILYKEAKILMKEERYLLATEKLNQIKNQFPYSYYATPSELMQADILFLQENYTDSAAAYLLFKDFHPKHPQSDYVVYKIAESYYKQLPETNDRDLEAASEAIKYYKELLRSYSKSNYTKDSKEKIEDCIGRIRAYEQYVADFYFKTEQYSAARWRYFDILSNFQENKLRSHSMQRIVQSSFYLKEYEKCITYADKYTQELTKSDKDKVSEYTKYCKEKL